MSFIGSTFTFDSISSERYGLKITTPDKKSTINISNYTSNVTKTNRQSKFHPLKQTVDEPLVLSISIFSETPVTRNQIDQIENWLFRTDGKFRKLRINQDDMNGYYYNCRLQKIEAETFGNMPYIINCLMQCDSSYVWQNPQKRVYTITSTPYITKFVNISSEDNLKPIYTITCNSDSGVIKIINSAYADEKQSTMEFTNLLNDEILTIDIEHEIITSNLRTSGLLDLFTYINFMRLPKGSNIFTITGNISEFKINYQNARKVGD